MRRAFIITVCCLCLAMQLASAGQNAAIKAENVTGWNRYLGQVRYQWDFLAPPLDLAGASTVGVYNPAAGEATPLTPDTPLDAVLATIADPFLNVTFPGALDAFPPDPSGLNLPLREVGTWTNGLINSRTTLPFQTEAPIATQSQAAPASPDPITLGDWLKASGEMQISCSDDGTAQLKIRVKDLIPNRAYTVWAMWHLADGRIFPQPFGGAPNAYITDDDGDGELSRELNFCPLTAASQGIDGNRLLSIITHLHSDHILYGAVPTPTGTGFPPGSVLHMQLEWNFPGVGIRLID